MDAQHNTARQARDRADLLNLKMERGGQENQWVVWNESAGDFVARGHDPSQGGVPAWIPRAVTNIVGTKIAGIAAVLDQADPAKLWAPATEDDEDRATAEVVQDADPVLLEEIDWATTRAEINRLVCLTDKVALLLYYDNDEKYGMQGIALAQCQNPECGKTMTPLELDETDGECPECGSGEEFIGPAIDPQSGVPAEVPYPKGRLCAEVIPSFEFSLPSAARSMDADKEPWVLLHSRMTVEDVQRQWPKAKAERSSGSSREITVARQMADRMRTLSGPRAQGRGGYDSDKLGPVVYRLQHDPITDREFHFPDGLYAVYIHDALVEAGPLPVQDDDGRHRKSIVLRTFFPVPCSPYGHPPADDLVPLGVTRNTVETLLLCILLHHAAPTRFIPLSVTFPEGQAPWSGIPGEDVYYASTVAGEKPEISRGTNPPEGIFRYLELLDAKIEEVSRLNSVLAGARPEGDPTLGEVQILQERGMASFTEPLQHLIEFEKRVSKRCLWIAKRSAWAPRFRQVRGENGAWDVKQFTYADLQGRIDVQVEPQSAWPKSPLMQMLRLEKALTLGVLPPPMQDPELQQKLLVEMNLAQFKPSLDHDRKQIAREIDRWKAAATPQEIEPPDPEIDNLPLHLFLKTLFLKTEEVETLARQNPPVYQAMRAHVAQIRMLLAQQQMAQAQAAAGGPPLDDRSAVEKGESRGVQDAVEAGVLVPKGAEGDPLEGMVNAGLLQSAGAAQAAQPAGPSMDELVASQVMTPGRAPEMRPQ